jgi:hypothetical protein
MIVYANFMLIYVNIIKKNLKKKCFLSDTNSKLQNYYYYLTQNYSSEPHNIFKN